MFRATLITVLAAASFATSAAAIEQANNDSDAAAISAFTAQLTAIANQQQMRKLLASQGYIVTSDLNRDDAGRWVGTALKDGNAVRVALKMPPRPQAEQLTN